MDLKIKGQFPSIQGIVSEIINEYQYTVWTQINNFYSHNTELNYQNSYYITSMLAERILPCIIYNISRKNIGEELKIASIRVEMYSDPKKNLIRTGNIDAGFTVTDKEAYHLNIGDEVNLDKVKGGITKIKINNRDENSAIMVFHKFGSTWYGMFDLIYNRQSVSKIFTKANGFLNGAEINLKAKNFESFYNDLWASFELYIQSVLLLHGSVHLGASHKKLTSEFKLFCYSYHLDLFDQYEKIKKIREDERYPQAHEPIKKNEKISNEFFTTTQFFKVLVNDYLKKNNVVLPITN